MKQQKTELHFLLALLGGTSILAFFIFKPFLYALILAVVFATVFNSLHQKILTFTLNKKSLSALLSTFIVLIMVVAPLTFLCVQIIKQATQLYPALAQNRGFAIESLTKFSPVPIDSLNINQYLEQGLSWLIQHLGSLFANVASALVGIFIFLISLYYLFKNGHKLKKAVITLSPLEDRYDETIFKKLDLAINSVIKGNLTVAFIQGILTSIGFAIFGVPNATLWGSIATITALIPGVGTAMVLVPAILYLFISGQTVPGIGLLVWGMTAVGLVDNVLGPKLASRGMKLHPFLILLSIFGGIGFFGPLGFILGPLVLSLLFALLDIYLALNKEHQNK